MPIQAPQWTDFLSCPICYEGFDESTHRPISLACGHTVCHQCLTKLHQKKCPFDQAAISRSIEELPVNFALLQLVGVAVPTSLEQLPADGLAENLHYYRSAQKCIEELAIFLKPVPTGNVTVTGSPNPLISRPMQRKLVTLVNCQLIEEEGQARAVRAARSLGERAVTKLILHHQNPQQLSANLWAAVRARGCQFLGPAMQEEVLKLILLALEDGSALSRKVLVLFVVQRLEAQYPQASKTAIGHVVQLLYRASCFKVTKRDEESSLMQLKDEFRTYDALRREHDAQIVQIATEAGLRISPEQWSSLLYGDTTHKSHMQSIIDKLQTPQSFSQSVNELVVALQRTGDPGNLSRLRQYFELLSNLDSSPDAPPPTWETLEASMKAVKRVIQGLVEFLQTRSIHKHELMPVYSTKYKTSMCRDLSQRGMCPRGDNCTFAHSQDEMEKYRARCKKVQSKPGKVMLQKSLSSCDTGELHMGMSQHDVGAGMLDHQVAVVPPLTNNQVDRLGRIPMVDERGITVPVAKPSNLPYTVSKVGQKAIYTSPAQGREESRSPVPNNGPYRFPPRPHYRPEGPYYGMTPISRYPPPLPGPLSSPYAAPPGGSYRESTPPLGYAMPQGPPMYDPAMAAYSPHWQLNGGTIPSGYYPTEEGLIRGPMPIQMMDAWSMPPRDSGYYGAVPFYHHEKSPSEQLEELHQRRNELIEQLSTSLTRASDVLVTSSSCQTNNNLVYRSSPSTYGSTSSQAMLTSLASSSSPQLQATCSLTTASSASSPFTSDMMRSKPRSHDLETARSTLDIGQHQQEDINDISSEVEDDSFKSCDIPNYVPWSGADSLLTDNQSSTTKDHDLLPVYELLPDCDSFSGSDWMDPEMNSSRTPQCRSAIETTPVARLFKRAELAIEDDDEFIPLEHTMVSKYGPISRTAKVKIKDTDPVQVTAAQPKDTTLVTALASSQRPHAVSAQVPSRFNVRYPQRNAQEGNVSGVATSYINPSCIPSRGNTSEPHTLWALKEKVLNMPGTLKPSAGSTAEREQIRHELVRLHKQIQQIELAEPERLARELQTVERDIQVTQRQMEATESALSGQISTASGRMQQGMIANQTVTMEANPPTPISHGTVSSQSRENIANRNPTTE